MNEKIVFMDSRGIIAGNPDSLRRHEQYAAAYSRRMKQQSQDELTFKVLSGSYFRECTPVTNSNFEVVYFGASTRFSISYMFKAFLSLRKEREEIRFFICGDPWETFWVTFLVRKMLRISSPIQMNIHADVFDSAWVSQTLANRLRKRILDGAIRSSDMIRVVSTSALKEIESRYPDKRVFCAPIPVVVPEQVITKSEVVGQVKTIGWVGRIAKDRGVLDFVVLLSRLNRIDKQFRVIVAGTGPLENNVKHQITSLLGEGRVDFVGRIEHASLPALLGRIDVLVSCAKSESYGLSMREALATGKPVWAVESKGVNVLREEFGSTYVKLIDFALQDHELVEVFQGISQVSVPVSVSIAIKKSSQESLNKLLDSWEMLGKPSEPRGIVLDDE